MKSIPERSEETKMIINLFLGLAPGETITKERVSAALGENVETHIGKIYVARSAVLKESAIVIEAVRCVGWKRLNGREPVYLGEQSRKWIHNKSKRTFQKITCANYNELSAEERIKYNLHASCFGALAAISTARAVKKIEARVQETQARLPLQRVLDLYK